VLTPLDDPRQACGIALLAVEGIKPGDLVSYLWAKHRIITTPIPHEEFQGVRVTPNVYTTLDEVDRFGDAVGEVLRKGL
jgi:selenocysteine lyase/cysteine desulfurase